MPLATLDQVGPQARDILVAAALWDERPEADKLLDSFVAQHQAQAKQLLKELRTALKLDPNDNSERALKLIDQAIVKRLDVALTSDADLGDAERRAGRQGLLSPAAYKVVQPKSYLNLFQRRLGVATRQTERAIREPDEYQHLLAEDTEADRDVFSIFLKKISARKNVEPCWLIVQTLRAGLTQVAQAAWWVYPSVVDLSQASEPLDVLKAFVNTFGVPLRVGPETGKFINGLNLKSLDENGQRHYDVQLPADHPEFFASWSHHPDPNDATLFKVGIGYCIDLATYEKSLRAMR